MILTAQNAETNCSLREEKRMVEIKCPFCGKTFSHIVREGVYFTPLIIVRAFKKEKYVLCPHCNKKIMQRKDDLKL
jgi:uncharacterized Zn-finger protein